MPHNEEKKNNQAVDPSPPTKTNDKRGEEQQAINRYHQCQKSALEQVLAKVAILPDVPLRLNINPDCSEQVKNQRPYLDPEQYRFG